MTLRFRMGIFAAATVGLLTERGLAAVWYVKPAPTGTGDCGSWANACGLETAAAAAAASVTWMSQGQIWVKKGTYQLSQAIRLTDYLSFFGGFNGNETAASQSKPFTNLTILRGGGGLADECGSAPLPMVYSKGNNLSAVFRGFVLENGNAPGDYEIYCSGGAMLIIDSKPRITNCIFRNNFGWLGGAVAVYGTTSRVRFSNCIFHGNGRKVVGTDPQTQQPIYQSNYAGGAVATWFAYAEFSNCLFYDNHSYEGGAIWTHPEAPAYTSLMNCTITANHASANAGGLSGGNAYHTISVRNSIVRGNFGGDVRGLRIAMNFCNVTRGEGEYALGYHPENIDADPLFVNAGAMIIESNMNRLAETRLGWQTGHGTTGTWTGTM